MFIQYDWNVPAREQLELVVSQMRPDDPWVIRFWLKVGQPVGPRSCRPWTGFVNPVSGYGQYGITRKAICKPTSLYAHRVAWILRNGLIQGGLTVDHDVDHGCIGYVCCETDHMELVTLSENGRRADATRYGFIGDDKVCRHGHVGERARTKSGVPYCRACNRERQRQRRAGQ